MIMFVVCYLPVHYIIVAGEPSKLTGVISSSNNTHVNVTVSWESPADTATTGNVIYYQPKTGGPVISESVTGGHRESHSLTGLQRGHTYNISIVALSQHLPSPLVGPVNVATGEPLNACSFVENSIETGISIYRCEATALNTTSFSDTTVFVMVETGML